MSMPAAWKKFRNLLGQGGTARNKIPQASADRLVQFFEDQLVCEPLPQA